MRRTTIALTASALAVLTALTACGGSAGESTAAGAADPVVVPVSGPTDTAVPAVTTDDTGEAADATSDEAEAGAGSPAPAEEGASSTGGAQPTLSWPAVDGAVLYSVVVHTADGQPFWGWLGESTSVTVGNGAPDPLVSSDMTWTVVALDAADDVVWESDPLPV